MNSDPGLAVGETREAKPAGLLGGGAGGAEGQGRARTQERRSRVRRSGLWAWAFCTPKGQIRSGMDSDPGRTGASVPSSPQVTRPSMAWISKARSM